MPVRRCLPLSCVPRRYDTPRANAPAARARWLAAQPHPSRALTPAPVLPQALTVIALLPLPRARNRDGAVQHERQRLGEKAKPTTSWVRLRSGACLVPQAAAAAHRPSSDFEFTAALSPLSLEDGEGGEEGMQGRGGGSCRVVRQPGRVRTEAGRTHSKTQKARRRRVASMICGARCLVWLPAAPAVPLAAAGSLNYRGLRLLRRPFLAGASASASCVLSRPRLFLLRSEGGQDPEQSPVCRGDPGTSDVVLNSRRPGAILIQSAAGLLFVSPASRNHPAFLFASAQIALPDVSLSRLQSPTRPFPPHHHTTPYLSTPPPAFAADDSARLRTLHGQPPSAVALATGRNVSPARTRWLSQLPRLACSTLNPLSLSALRTPWRHQGLATDLGLLALMGRTPTCTATYHPPARRRELPRPGHQLEPFSFRRKYACNWLVWPDAARAMLPAPSRSLSLSRDHLWRLETGDLNQLDARRVPFLGMGVGLTATARRRARQRAHARVAGPRHPQTKLCDHAGLEVCSVPPYLSFLHSPNLTSLKPRSGPGAPGLIVSSSRDGARAAGVL
ncbi:hypothetical protein V8D89_007757 [Ganoderma adspersum]